MVKRFLHRVHVHNLSEMIISNQTPISSGLQQSTQDRPDIVLAIRSANRNNKQKKSGDSCAVVAWPLPIDQWSYASYDAKRKGSSTELKSKEITTGYNENSDSSRMSCSLRNSKNGVSLVPQNCAASKVCSRCHLRNESCSAVVRLMHRSDIQCSMNARAPRLFRLHRIETASVLVSVVAARLQAVKMDQTCVLEFRAEGPDIVQVLPRAVSRTLEPLIFERLGRAPCWKNGPDVLSKVIRQPIRASRLRQKIPSNSGGTDSRAAGDISTYVRKTSIHQNLPDCSTCSDAYSCLS
jgi:hypothetical protein